MSAWDMPTGEAQSLLDLLNERLATRLLEVRQHDALVRLRAILEEDLTHSPRDGTSPVEMLAHPHGPEDQLGT